MLTIINNAAMNMSVQVAVKVPRLLLLSMYAELELLDHMEIQFFIFEELISSTINIGRYNPHKQSTLGSSVIFGE